MKRIISILALTVFAALSASADEGMWMINAIDRALEKNMKARGLRLGAREIYDADAKGTTLSDAVVALDFACTGSIISDKGLLITNHHCAYADVHRMSTPEKNYLEDGFWAFKSEEEKPIPGKKVYFLKKVLDVTDEVEELKQSWRHQGKAFGMRKLGWMMEKKYREEHPGLEASLGSMWGGEKYYIALYEVYGDIRLVAAPPVSIAAFGGDTDNWEWPQHKCDFALYRVYTAPDGKPAVEYSPDNVPLKPLRKLDISLKGYGEGSFAMVLGYPGTTSRYNSSAETAFDVNVSLPVSNRLRAAQMEIIRRGMDSSPLVRLLYADRFFSLSNVQELKEGEVQCIKRFEVVQKKAEEEVLLNGWIREDPEREAKWGTLIGDLYGTYSRIADAERDVTYYRETLVRGSQMGMAAVRVANLLGNAEKESADSITGQDYPQDMERIRRLYDGIDLSVERELFTLSLREFFSNVSPEMFSTYQKELYRKFCPGYGTVATEASGGEMHEAVCRGLQEMADWMWENSYLSDRSRLETFLSGNHSPEEYAADPVYRFYKEIKVVDFNMRIRDLEGDMKLSDLRREYTHALYEMRCAKGRTQYPDANSTLRLTYGRIGGISPRDGVRCGYMSSVAGVLEKNDTSSHDFCLKDDWRELLESGDFSRCRGAIKSTGKAGTADKGQGSSSATLPVNFLCDCDITGGNSGSPVLNARGELIGLAFDGNKESLASDVSYTDGYNKCVCVDIRYVLFVLDRYARLDRILSELGL